MCVCVCVCSSVEAVKSSSAGSASVRSLMSDDDDDDDDTASLERYGEVDVAKYNEDGSFVGAYTLEPATRQRGRVATSRSNSHV